MLSQKDRLAQNEEIPGAEAQEQQEKESEEEDSEDENDEEEEGDEKDEKTEKKDKEKKRPKKKRNMNDPATMMKILVKDQQRNKKQPKFNHNKVKEKSKLIRNLL